MIVEALDERQVPGWDEFVRNMADGTLFHLAAWRTALEQSYGFPCHYLLAREGNSIRGVLPLALVRRPFAGSVLISTPLCVYGGVLADDAASLNALESAATDLACKHRVRYLELRNRVATRSDWPVNSCYATFRRPLPETAEAVLKTIPRKQRAEVRKGRARKLAVEADRDLSRFYPIYAYSVLRLGSPVFPRRYFESLLACFPEATEILTVTHDGRAVASLLSFYYQDTVLPYHAGGLPQAGELSAYPVLYATLMERAVERGYRHFDFGRSIEGSGAYAFKKNWGFEPTPLAYQYCLIGAKTPPSMRPDNPRLRPLVSAWKWLPLPVANAIGPYLSRMVV